MSIGILIFEKDHQKVRQIRDVLKADKQNHKVKATDSAEGFQKLMETFSPDVVICSILSLKLIDPSIFNSPEESTAKPHLIIYCNDANDLNEDLPLDLEIVEFLPLKLINRLPGLLNKIQKLKREQQLIEQQERFKIMVQNMPVLVDAFDENNTLVFWNHECERVTGYKAEEIVGNPKGMEILYPDPEYRDKIFDLWAKKGDNFRNWEITIQAKDGSKKIISWSNLSDMYSVSGWKSWAIGIDVTARYNAEKELELQNFHLKTLLDIDQDLHSAHSPEQICNIVLNYVKKIIPFEAGLVLLYEPEKEFAKVLTAKFEKQILYRADNVIPLQNLLRYDEITKGKIVYVDDLKPYKSGVRIASLLLKQGLNAGIIVPLKRGKKVIGSLSLYFKEPYKVAESDEELLLQIAGRMSFVLQQTNLMDQLREKVIALEQQTLGQMAELKKREHRLRAQYDSIPIPTYTWQKSRNDFILVDYNDMAMAATYGKIGEYLGQKASEIYKELPQMPELLLECYENEISMETQIETINQSDNQKNYLSVKLAYVAPDSVLMHVEDITEQIEATQNIKKLKQLINYQTKMIDFLREDIDIIKDQLFPMFQKHSESLYNLKESLSENEENIDSDKCRVFIRQYEELHNRFRSMIDLYMGYFQLDNRAITFQKVDLNSLLEKLFSRFEKRLKETQTKTHVYLENQFIKSDPDVLFDILAKLLAFSVEHREASRKPIVRIVNSLKDDRIIISLKDNGRGVAKSLLRSLFDYIPASSENFDSSLKSLTLVKKMVRMLGGHFQVDSVEGEGTNFTLSFPRFDSGE
ncbi:MAG: PAS domain S-box protein [Calditrichaeota bacterium]|nr:PAS domain S-box protein [Calditrichota bacterium]